MFSEMVFNPFKKITGVSKFESTNSHKRSFWFKKSDGKNTFPQVIVEIKIKESSSFIYSHKIGSFSLVNQCKWQYVEQSLLELHTNASFKHETKFVLVCNNKSI